MQENILQNLVKCLINTDMDGIANYGRKDNSFTRSCTRLRPFAKLVTSHILVFSGPVEIAFVARFVATIGTLDRKHQGSRCICFWQLEASSALSKKWVNGMIIGRFQLKKRCNLFMENECKEYTPCTIWSPQPRFSESNHEGVYQTSQIIEEIEEFWARYKKTQRLKVKRMWKSDEGIKELNVIDGNAYRDSYKPNVFRIGSDRSRLQTARTREIVDWIGGIDLSLVKSLEATFAEFTCTFDHVHHLGKQKYWIMIIRWVKLPKFHSDK